TVSRPSSDDRAYWSSPAKYDCTRLRTHMAYWSGLASPTLIPLNFTGLSDAEDDEPAAGVRHGRHILGELCHFLWIAPVRQALWLPAWLQSRPRSPPRSSVACHRRLSRFLGPTLRRAAA